MAVALLALVLVGVSFWMGTYLAVFRHTGISFYLFIAAIGGALGGLLAIWSETTSEVRIWGSNLFGKTALGWRRVDLANLTSAAIAAGRGRRSIILGDSGVELHSRTRSLERSSTAYVAGCSRPRSRAA